MDKNIMQHYDNFHFHKGHYLEKDIAQSLLEVENDKYLDIQCEEDDSTDYLYSNAGIFLHGSCNLFALALHEEFKYKVYEIRDNENRMTHVFCKSTYHGQDVYIDIRGITTNCTEIFSEFENFLYRGYCITEHDIEIDKQLENEGDKTGYSFARSVIKRFRAYYDVSI